MWIVTLRGITVSYQVGFALEFFILTKYCYTRKLLEIFQLKLEEIVILYQLNQALLAVNSLEKL
ncbi:hypothetical protein DW018_08345 [Eubacterium ventriosum]|uniref:Uncharacterized protein n=1 Tax=Eubacterium ventriosum TaxID=39496 RepID=A0A415L7Q3_9FIRM|nr:hypothetical protein DW018_08345 [Eubacterium ventriosum]